MRLASEVLDPSRRTKSMKAWQHVPNSHRDLGSGALSNRIMTYCRPYGWGQNGAIRVTQLPRGHRLRPWRSASTRSSCHCMRRAWTCQALLIPVLKCYIYNIILLYILPVVLLLLLGFLVCSPQFWLFRMAMWSEFQPAELCSHFLWHCRCGIPTGLPFPSTPRHWDLRSRRG